MTGTNKGYIFPNPFDPGALRCIKVYVPDDTMYIGAFFNAYRYFGSPQAWANDDAHTALEVAELWRTAYELARVAFEEGDCDMKFDIRVNPANHCQMQASTDGGLTWHLALDLNCGGGVPPAPEEDDTEGGKFPGLYIRQFVITILNMVDETSDYNDFLAAWLAMFGPTGIPNGTLTAMANGVWAKKPGSMPADITDECEYECLYDKLKAFRYDDPILFATEFTANWLSLQFCTAFADLEKVIHDTAVWMGANVLSFWLESRDPLGDAGLDFGASCTATERCDDFTESDDHWTISGFGEYVGGADAFMGTLNPTTNWYQIDMRSNITPFGAVGQVRVDWGNSSSGNGIEIYINGVLEADVEGGPAGARTEIIPVGGVVNNIRIKCEQSTLNLGPHVYSVCFEDV